MDPRTLLRELMERDNDNPNSLAAKLNNRTRQPQIHKFLAGIAREPRRSTLKPLADHYKVDIEAFYDPNVARSEWLRIFVGDAKTLAHDNPATIQNSQNINADFSGHHEKSTSINNIDDLETTRDIVIPQYDTGGAMGGGRLLLADQPGLIKSWHVDHEWVRLNVKHYSSLVNLCIVTGFGNSMKPMFNPGDPLLVDRGVNTVDHEGVFFFRIGDQGYIKQLQRIPDPMSSELIFRAKSKNPDYDPFDIHPSNPHFAVLGKVLTIWKSDQF